MSRMWFYSKHFHLPVIHHNLVTVVEDMAIMAVHEDEVGSVNLASCMEVTDEHLAIFYQKLLVNVSFLRSMDQNQCTSCHGISLSELPLVGEQSQQH